MAFIVADRVRDTSITTGTGPFALSGTAPNAYQTFSAVCAVADTFLGWIANQSANEWEVGLYTYSAANQITRTVVNASSNGGAAVVFTAGTKDVVLSPNALGGNLLFSDGTGIKSSETGTPNILLVNSVASAVNWVEITNAATGNKPSFSAAGTDADIGLSFKVKGNPGFGLALSFDLGGASSPSAAFLNTGGQGPYVVIGTSQAAAQVAGDFVGGFEFAGRNSTPAAQAYGGIDTYVVDPTAGVARGQFGFYVNNSGYAFMVGQGVGIGDFEFGTLVDPGQGNLAFSDNRGIYVESHPALIFQDTASAVTYLEVTNQVTTVNPTIGAAGESGLGVGFTTYVEMTEMTAPAAGPVNTCRLFTQDNGGGKTQLMAIFNTGAAQQVAIQP
jgi:hypothetical protein